MDRREMLGRSGALVMSAVANGRSLSLVGIGGLALVTTACPSDKALTNSRIVIAELEAAEPFLVELIPNSADLLTKVIAVAKDLRAALENKSDDALGLLEQIISANGLFNQVMATLDLVQDENKRRIISGSLLLANVALRVIAANLKEVETEQPALAKAARARSPKAATTIDRAAFSVEGTLKQLRF